MGMILAMQAVRDRQFNNEVVQFAFAFNCEQCGHFCATERACAHEWPVALHLREHYAKPTPEVVFCKEFEAR